MNLVKITSKAAIFTQGGKIFSKPLDKGAQDILAWYWKNLPANDDNRQVQEQN